MAGEEIVKRISGKKHITAVYEVRGERIEIWFDPTNSWRPFSAEYKDKVTTAQDIDALLEDLKRITKRPRITVHIPITRVGGADGLGRDGFITGRHGSNKNILITWSDGRSEQLDNYSQGVYGSRQTFFKVLTNEQKKELKELKNAHVAAEANLAAFEREFGPRHQRRNQ